MRHFFVAIALVLFAFTEFSHCHEIDANVNEKATILAPSANGTLDESWAFPAQTDVVLLNAENFDKYLEEKEMLFVEFFAPWCVACMKVARDYEEVATELKKQGSDIVIAKVDCVKETHLVERYEIKGYPTFLLFRHGTKIDYNRPYEKQYILEYLESKKASTSTELKSKDDLQKFLQAMDKPKAVAVVDDSNLRTWKSVTDAENIPIALAHTYDASILGDDDVKVGSLRIFSPVDNEITDLDGKFVKTKIVKFLEKNKNPLIRQLNNEVWYEHAAQNTPIYVILFKEGEQNLQLAKEIAMSVEGIATITFRVLDENQIDFISDWTVSGEFFPTIVQITWGKELSPKYAAYDEESGALTLESATDFITRSLEGKYTPFIRSQPIPETNDGPVKILVGKNFNDIAMDSSKITAVLLYADWCPYSQAALPVWEQVAVALGKSENVVFAKADISENTFPEIIASFDEAPTIILMMNDNEKTVVEYNGKRGARQIASFIAKKAEITDIDLSVLSEEVPEVKEEEVEGEEQ